MSITEDKGSTDERHESSDRSEKNK
jgi:hypothetical protein